MEIVDEDTYYEMIEEIQDKGSMDADVFFDKWVKCIGGESDFSVDDAMDAFMDASEMKVKYKDASNRVAFTGYRDDDEY